MSSSTGEKARAVFLAALMVLSVVAMSTAFTGTAAAQTDTVTVDNLSDLRDNVSESGDATAGDTIVVEEGDYPQTNQIKVTLDDLTIRAVDGQDPTIQLNSNEQFRIESDNVTVTDLTFDRAQSDGNTNPVINIVADSPTIEDNTVNSGTIGGKISGDFVLRNNSISGNNPNNDAPIFTFGVSSIGDVTIEQNDISGFADPSDSTADVKLDVSNIGSVNGNANPTEGARSILSSNTGVDSVIAAGPKVTVTGPDDTIQDAVDRASQDFTVIVESGTYDESVSISTANVTLESTGGADATTIDLGPNRINVGANNITIDGFSFVFESQAIYEAGNQGVTIQNNHFELAEGTESQGYAIRFEGSSSGGVARNNEFVGIDNTVQDEYGNGIVVAGPDGHEIIGNDFTNNSIGLNVGGNQPAGALKVANNNFTQQDNLAIALNHDDLESPGFNITGNQIESNEVGILVLAGGSINIKENKIVDNGVDASALSGDTVNATSNWWGATNGPGGDFNGNGSAVAGSVTVDPATVSLEDGSVNLTQDFLGVVKDSQNVTLSDTSDATFSFDSESVPGDVDGTLVLGINGTDYVFEDALNEGEVDTAVGGGAADSGKTGASIADTTPTGDTAITVVGNNSTTAVSDTGTITLVHEALGLNEGFNLKSVPQPAKLYTQDVDATNQWNPSDDTYESPDISQGEDVDSGTDLHRGLYVDAASSDARLGYSFATSEVPQPADVVMGNGWHLVGSNFDIDSESGTRELDVDLRNVETVTQDGSPGVTAYDSGLSGDIAGNSTINEYDTYWVYVDGDQTRVIVAPNYDPNGR